MHISNYCLQNVGYFFFLVSHVLVIERVVFCSFHHLPHIVQVHRLEKNGKQCAVALWGMISLPYCADRETKQLFGLRYLSNATSPHEVIFAYALYKILFLVIIWDQHVKTLNVRGPSYLGLTRSISWLLMPWLLTSPGHQQPRY